MHPHMLIIGRTGSGKSGDGYTRENVFGHIAAEWESWVDKDFVGKLKKLTGRKDRVFVIIDEAHEFFTRARCENLWIGIRGRHYGINIVAITQQGQQINPTFRGAAVWRGIFVCL